MPKPHKSGLATTAEANEVGRFLVASHSYTLSGEDGTIEDVEATSFMHYADAVEMAKKLAVKNPGEKIVIFARTSIVEMPTEPTIIGVA